MQRERQSASRRLVVPAIVAAAIIVIAAATLIVADRLQHPGKSARFRLAEAKIAAAPEVRLSRDAAARVGFAVASHRVRTFVATVRLRNACEAGDVIRHADAVMIIAGRTLKLRSHSGSAGREQLSFTFSLPPDLVESVNWRLAEPRLEVPFTSSCGPYRYLVRFEPESRQQ